MNEPLSPAAAKTLVLAILESGNVRLMPYSSGRMDQRAVTLPEIFATLRGGVVEPAEFRNGTWRYRFRSGRIYVVVRFEVTCADTFAIVITTWRISR